MDNTDNLSNEGEVTSAQNDKTLESTPERVAKDIEFLK